MSWMKRLYEIYENNIEKVGEFEDRGDTRFTLLPVSHVTQSAQIEVTLDRGGHFFNAKVVPKEKARTIVPATIQSANRSSAPAPHFIHDKLFYVAGDYLTYGGEEKRSKNYSLYMNQMREWIQSPFTHSKIEMIYEYVNKGTLIEDLIKEKVLFTDENNKLIEKWTTQDTEKYGREKPEIYKVVTGNSSESLVRFTILPDAPTDPPLWEDKELFEVFQAYYTNLLNKESDTGLCYVSGQITPLTDKHGSRLRNAGDMSKLISSNDSVGFTYRGRFEKPEQAVQIGYEVSQKAHNALRWINQRQGHRSGNRHFITFGVKDPTINDPFHGTVDMNKNLGIFNEFESSEKKEEHTNLVLAEQVQQAFQGKKHQFDVNGTDQVIIMAVDAATTGRLALVYYQELDGKLFLDRLSHWHQTCKWSQFYYDKNSKKMIRFIGTPSTYQIVESIYGERADEKVKKELYTRLLPCIVDRAAIPKDIVRSIFNRVKNPMSFKSDSPGSSSDFKWQQTLNIACALIRKQYEKEGIDVTLDVDNRDRDYLFGRLLAVAEVLERSELDQREEGRATNALRYFNAYSQRPARTWKTIRQQLHPYQMRGHQSTKYFTRIINDIESIFTIEEFNNDPLGPLFLVGYSSQIRELYTKKDKKEGDTQNESN